jgi:hypothetical protein
MCATFNIEADTPTAETNRTLSLLSRILKPSVVDYHLTS